MMLTAFYCRGVMLRVDAKQGAPKDGNSPLELFQVSFFSLNTSFRLVCMWTNYLILRQAKMSNDCAKGSKIQDVA